MKNNDLIKEMKELLEIEDDKFSLNSSLNLTSLHILSIISFVDENFDMRIKAADLKSVNTLEDLKKIIGNEKFQD